MKKLCVLLATIMLVAATGCGNGFKSGRLINEMVEKTHTAIEDGRVEEALNYGKIALQEGHDDDEFAELMECLELYLDVEEALDENDLKTAKDKYDKLVEYDNSDISDLEDDLEDDLNDKMEEADEIIESLGYAVENDKDDDDFVASSQSELEDFVLTEEQERELEKIIEEHENKPADGGEGAGEVYFPTAQEIDGYVESLEDGINRYDTALVASVMVKLYRLEPYMNEHQRKRTFAYWNEWNEIQKATEPPVMISPDEALEIAREALDIPSHGSIVVVQNGEYYIARAEVDYGDFVDECGCNISTYDGEVFGQVG